MKIKLDFVTNSSSVCYLIASAKAITKKSLQDQGIPPTHIDYIETIRNRKKLIEVTMQTEGECDWVTEATGASRFYGISKEWYEMSLKSIQEGDFICLIDMDRNHYETTQRLEKILQDESTILGVQSD